VLDVQLLSCGRPLPALMGLSEIYAPCEASSRRGAWEALTETPLLSGPLPLPAAFIDGWPWTQGKREYFGRETIGICDDINAGMPLKSAERERKPRPSLFGRFGRKWSVSRPCTLIGVSGRKAASPKCMPNSSSPPNQRSIPQRGISGLQLGLFFPTATFARASVLRGSWLPGVRGRVNRAHYRLPDWRRRPAGDALKLAVLVYSVRRGLLPPGGQD